MKLIGGSSATWRALWSEILLLNVGFKVANCSTLVLDCSLALLSAFWLTLLCDHSCAALTAWCHVCHAGIGKPLLYRKRMCHQPALPAWPLCCSGCALCESLTQPLMDHKAKQWQAWILPNLNILDAESKGHCWFLNVPDVSVSPAAPQPCSLLVLHKMLDNLYQSVQTHAISTPCFLGHTVIHTTVPTNCGKHWSL